MADYIFIDGVDELNFFWKSSAGLSFKNLSIDFPIQYGVISIIFAIVLGVGAAFVRKFFSNLRKKYAIKTDKWKINFFFIRYYFL